MPVYHYQDEYSDHYSVSDSDIVHLLGNYAGFAEVVLMDKAEEVLTGEKLQEGFAILRKDIRRVLFEDFKINKSLNSYNDNELARTIMFPSPEDEDNYYRSAMIVIVKIMDRLQKEISQYRGDYICREVFGAEAAFLYQVLFQVCEFTNHVAARQERKNYGGSYSRKHRLSMETYRMSREITRGRIYNNDITHFSESIFLIRQTIEIKVLEALQLQTVWNKKHNREVKVAPDAFIGILDDNAVKFIDIEGNRSSVDISYIKKVHHWTNLFIHTGHTYWTWEVEFVRDTIADFALNQVFIEKEYRKSIPEKILDCINDEEKADVVVVMTPQFYRETGISSPE